MSNDEIKKQFSRQFFGSVGTIEDGEQTAVTMTSLSTSWHSVPDRSKQFDCKPNEQALLVEWIPAGMQFTERKMGKLPKEAGVDESQVPPKDEWIIFPKSYNGLPVYYRRGQMAFAC